MKSRLFLLTFGVLISLSVTVGFYWYLSRDQRVTDPRRQAYEEAKKKYGVETEIARNPPVELTVSCDPTKNTPRFSIKSVDPTEKV